MKGDPSAALTRKTTLTSMKTVFVSLSCGWPCHSPLDSG